MKEAKLATPEYITYWSSPERLWLERIDLIVDSIKKRKCPTYSDLFYLFNEIQHSVSDDSADSVSLRNHISSAFLAVNNFVGASFSDSDSPLVGEFLGHLFIVRAIIQHRLCKYTPEEIFKSIL